MKSLHYSEYQDSPFFSLYTNILDVWHNVEDLTKSDFGVLDVGDIVDTLEGAMEDITGERFIFSLSK